MRWSSKFRSHVCVTDVLQGERLGLCDYSCQVPNGKKQKVVKPPRGRARAPKNRAFQEIAGELEAALVQFQASLAFQTDVKGSVNAF